MRIVILDGHAANPGDLPTDELQALGEVEFHDSTPPSLVVERAKSADAILINKVRIGEDELAALPHLRYIGLQATGYNTVDLAACTRHHVTVCNVPAYSTMSVAQQTIAHLLGYCNSVEHYAHDVRKGKWSQQQPHFCYWDTPLIELHGKHLGIIGYGNIGRQVERIAQALGMHVSHTSARSTDRTALNAMLAHCHVVSLHCPATPQTTEMVNEDFLSMMQPGAILINTARGQLVNETHLLAALDSGHISAYLADTLTIEPPSADHPLAKHPHARITPHNAWATKEARTRLQSIVADNLRAFIEGHPQNVVNE